MNCFVIIKKVLDHLWQNIPGNDEEKTKLVTLTSGHLRKQYLSYPKRDPIDYSTPHVQFAYLYMYTAAHADYLFQVLKLSRSTHNLPRENSFHLVSLGGGPGSDLLGFLKYFDLATDVDELNFKYSSFDKDGNWSFRWSALTDFIQTECHNAGICSRYSAAFHTLDVCNMSAISEMGQFLDADAYTLMYFFSEIASVKKTAYPFLREFFTKIQPGATLIFIDINYSDVYNDFDGLMRETGFKVLHAEGRTITPSMDEQSSTLAEYKQVVGMSPKLKGDIACRVMQKT